VQYTQSLLHNLYTRMLTQQRYLAFTMRKQLVKKLIKYCLRLITKISPSDDNLHLLGTTPDPPSSGMTRTACHQSASSSPTTFRMCPNLNSRPRPGSPASNVGS